MKNIGVITYAFPHLKTEQILSNFCIYPPPANKCHLTVFALPFKYRSNREVFFQHRPNQIDAVSPDVLCTGFGLEYVKCSGDADISGKCDIYIIAGAGIISLKTLKDKKIINCHPGIIPASRGLDSFKWAIFNMLPLGNTLHYIDENVDMGKIISVVKTPVFITDSLETLARRHYENEITLLSKFEYYTENPVNDFANIQIRESTKRMDFETEAKMCRLFDEYKEKFALPYTPLSKRSV